MVTLCMVTDKQNYFQIYLERITWKVILKDIIINPLSSGLRAKFSDRNNRQRICLADKFYFIKAQEKITIAFFIVTVYNKFNKIRL